MAFACLAASLLHAGEVQPHDLGPTLAPLINDSKLPGAVGAIVRGNDIVALGSAGIRKVGDSAPFLATDTIHLGSDTKAMTAILIGQLIDKKQFKFDTPMREIFPDLAAGMNPEKAKVTVRDLLDHNAGFPHDLNWWTLDATHAKLPAQRRKAVAEALAAPPAQPIGAFFYSNVSYVVLGAIVESKTGKAWEEVIQSEIFAPLKMTSAGFGPPGTPGKVDQPWGHSLKNSTLQPSQFDNAPVLGPAGTVHCSMSDWCKFVSQILLAAQGKPAFISEATFKELTTPKPKQDYAGGWIIAQRPWAGGLALTHAGSNTTWFCTVWIAPQKNFAALIAINDGSDPAPKVADDGIGKLIEFSGHLP
ncbi:MAG TPA: serine hydrolase domain-containing protein [Planctomycetota bacterium]|nr:serine hydrolase domain-containing protein [Planctomycetota bacterium]